MEIAGGRAIIHVDMDAFYASVERLDDPSLHDKPVIVGGLGPRGVVATASYEARKFGVHSAMPMTRARRLCPRACFIRPRMARYRELSAAVFAIFRAFTPQVEGLSLDEAFLDVSGSVRLFGTPLAIARQIKQRIRDETGLTASVGLAANKFLAKLASDANKPDGLLWVQPGEVTAFLDPMPISRLWGIGKQTAPGLRALGILTIGQLRKADAAVLRPVLGNRVEHFQRLARGADEREVEPDRPDRSISHEVTFDRDLLDRAELLAELQRQAESVARRLREQGLMARTVMVKIRDGRFRTVTRSRSLRACSSNTRTLYRMARALFETWRESHRSTPLRLLGMGVSGLEDADTGEAAGDRLDSRGERDIDRVFDRINRRYGESKIVHGQTLRRKKT
ncbi:MAG: DNA polymerase IV [Lysobacterales bacterium]|nr:MAG: DNA polymerase IV [Xanthomonadales bacterium]